MTHAQQTRMIYVIAIMFGIAIAIGMMAYKFYNNQLDPVVAIEVGLMLCFAACVGVGFLAASRIGRKEIIETGRAEIVPQTGKVLVIPKEDYLTSISALGDKMASPDPEIRQLAALAYDAFRSSVEPSR